MPMAIDPAPFIAARRSGATPDELSALRRPLIGYGGPFSERIEWELLRAVAGRTRGTLVLIGPVVNNHKQSHVELEALAGRANVCVLGHKTLDEAPSYIAALDVGLIPYKRNPFNDGSNPVKFYEYLAAGLPVVSVGIPALRALPVGRLVRFADEPMDFAAAAEEQAESRSDDRAVAERQAFANRYRFGALIGRIEEEISAGRCFRNG